MGWWGALRARRERARRRRRDRVLRNYPVVGSVCRVCTPAGRAALADELEQAGFNQRRTMVTSRLVLRHLAGRVRGSFHPSSVAVAEDLADALAPNSIVDMQKAQLIFEAGALALALDSGRVTAAEIAAALRAY